MDIDTHLHAILTSSPAPTTLGAAYYPVIAPPKSTGRHSVYQVVTKLPLYTQDGDPEGTRIWHYQFRQFAPSFADVIRDSASLRDFLVGYRDRPAPGILRVIELNSMDLPLTATGRLFCRMVELDIAENL